MLSLAETQARVASALLGAGGADVAAIVADDGVAPEARLTIYRHHFVTSLTAALQAIYPVVHRLVGDGFFRYAAHEFVTRRPPSRPCLFEYGEGFDEFLAAFPPCRELAYLGDVARLEWAMNTALHAEVATPLDLGALRSLDASEIDRLTVGFDRSVTLLSSPWAVDAIWRANQADADPDATVDATAGPVHLEVRRLGDDVVFRRLAPATYEFRRALLAGEDLTTASAAGHGADPDFDLAAALHELFTDDVLTSFRATTRPEETP